MILWTLVSDEAFWEPAEPPKELDQEVVCNGVRMVIEPISLRQGRIKRIISTDPAVYLRPDLAPGTIIEFSLANCRSQSAKPD